MTAHRPTLSLAGCRTRAEAETRLRGWLEQAAADQVRRLHTDLVTLDAGSEQSTDVAKIAESVEGGSLDVDEIDRVLAASESQTADVIDEAMRWFGAQLGPER